jgi:hypothetical protein
LVEGASGRDLLGTKAILRKKDGTMLFRQSRSEGSYCSTQDTRILYGLGKKSDIAEIEFIWPDGTKEVWSTPVSGRYTTLIKGKIK